MIYSIALFFSGKAQQLSPDIISSQGGTNTAKSITLEWTLGELAIESIRTPEGIITEGFHQPRLEVQIEPKEWGENQISSDYEISVAPNPVKSALSVNVKAFEESRVNLELYDLTGKTLQSFKIEMPQENFQIDMHTYHSGMYLLRFKNEEGFLIETFKITKVD